MITDHTLVNVPQVVFVGLFRLRYQKEMPRQCRQLNLNPAYSQFQRKTMFNICIQPRYQSGVPVAPHMLKFHQRPFRYFLFTQIMLHYYTFHTVLMLQLARTGRSRKLPGLPVQQYSHGLGCASLRALARRVGCGCRRGCPCVSSSISGALLSLAQQTRR